MNEELKSWDEIPSLDDLKVDWDYQPENPNGKRDSKRLTDKELIQLFGVPCIAIKIATTQAICKGLLQDISENGLAIRLQQPPLPGEKVKLGFFLGTHKIICKGIVRHTWLMPRINIHVPRPSENPSKSCAFNIACN